MGEFEGGLEEEEAVRRLEGVEAAVAQVRGERPMVGGRILAAEGQLEAAPAVGLAVAGPGVA
ncbi:MAG: hypothetical protein ACKOET_06010, partial [Verrucomicrobiota bacterium]